MEHKLGLDMHGDQEFLSSHLVSWSNMHECLLTRASAMSVHCRPSWRPSWHRRTPKVRALLPWTEHAWCCHEAGDNGDVTVHFDYPATCRQGAFHRSTCCPGHACSACSVRQEAAAPCTLKLWQADLELPFQWPAWHCRC